LSLSQALLPAVLRLDCLFAFLRLKLAGEYLLNWMGFLNQLLAEATASAERLADSVGFVLTVGEEV